MFVRIDQLPRVAVSFVAAVLFAGAMLGAAASVLPVA